MHSDVMPRQSHSEQETENTGVHVSFVSKEECRVCYAFRLHASSVTHRTRKRKYSCSCFFLFYAKLLFLLQLYCRLVFACFCSVVLFVGLLPHVTCLCMYECSYVVFIDHVLEVRTVCRGSCTHETIGVSFKFVVSVAFLVYTWTSVLQCPGCLVVFLVAQCLNLISCDRH